MTAHDPDCPACLATRVWAHLLDHRRDLLSEVGDDTLLADFGVLKLASHADGLLSVWVAAEPVLCMTQEEVRLFVPGSWIAALSEFDDYLSGRRERVDTSRTLTEQQGQWTRFTPHQSPHIPECKRIFLTDIFEFLGRPPTWENSLGNRSRFLKR